tara:strand:+ start:2670 stop:3266 length:597 start_codon:yes stop_codon:yes gene_type:complete
MEEKDTYQRVAIPMTEKQAHEAFGCETCKGFNGSLQVLTEMIERTFSTEGATVYLKHLDLVASPVCDGQCVEGSTMSIVCPCCGDSVYFNYSCFLPTEIKCIHCSADLTGGDHEGQLAIRRIIKDHNQMRWTCRVASDHMINEEIAKYNDLREPRGGIFKSSHDIPSLHDTLKKTVHWEDIVGPVKGYGEDTQEDEES